MNFKDRTLINLFYVIGANVAHLGSSKSFSKFARIRIWSKKMARKLRILTYFLLFWEQSKTF